MLEWMLAITTREKSVADGRLLMSTDNKTLSDFWNEWQYGVNGKESLKSLEAQTNGIWRNDPPGSGRFKQFWAQRSPIYAIILSTTCLPRI
jgi:hypothetical protein